jgi:hypothetical protein
MQNPAYQTLDAGDNLRMTFDTPGRMTEHRAVLKPAPKSAG